MSTSHRNFAAGLALVALVGTAIALISGGDSAVSAFIAEVAGGEQTDPSADGALTLAPPAATFPAADGVSWDAEDGDDADSATWSDPAVRPLRVRVVGLDQAPAGGVPVVLLGSQDDGPVLAGPKLTNADGRVRFPIDIALEREHDIVVAARAMPGAAASANVKVVLDQPADVTLAIDTGWRATIQVQDPEGRPIDGPVRVRKAILGEAAPESGPRAPVLSQVFAETTPRAIRVAGGFQLVGLRSPEDFTLFVAAAGFAPAYREIQVPAQAPAPFPIEVRLETRTSVVRFEAVAPPGIERSSAAFCCHRVEGSGVLMAAGVDELPLQKSPSFSVDVPPNDAHRLEVCAWVDGQIHASAEIEVPALREGEVFDGGRLRLELLPVVLAGLVVDQDQAPLAKATIEAIGRARSRDLAATTGADGAFTLRAPSGRGPYQVSAHATGRVSERISSVSEPALGLKFVLEPSGTIEGSLVLSKPIDRDRVSVRAITNNRPAFVTTLDRTGAFSISGLPRGVYTVLIESGGIHPIQITDVVVNPPEVTRDGRLDRVHPRLAAAQQGQP